jgi:hypothetical protein
MSGQTRARVTAAHLPDMTTTTPLTLPATAGTGAVSAVPVLSPEPASLGARLAASSRAAQGLGPTVTDPDVLARLQEMCATPRPPITTTR